MLWCEILLMNFGPGCRGLIHFRRRSNPRRVCGGRLADGNCAGFAAASLSASNRGIYRRFGVAPIDWSVPKFEIGYWVGTRFARKGYITEAVKRIERFAFEQLGTHAWRFGVTRSMSEAGGWRSTPGLSWKEFCETTPALQPAKSAARAFTRKSAPIGDFCHIAFFRHREFL